MTTMNLGCIHDNGEPRLHIGLRKNNGFIIEYNPSLQMITFTDSSTGIKVDIFRNRNINCFFVYCVL